MAFKQTQNFFVKKCLICAKHNSQGNLRPLPGRFPPPIYPFQEIHMDFIQLNKSNGKQYALVILDAFTDWTEIFPTSAPDAISVAKALCCDVIPRYGIPEIIRCNNGTHFVNEIIALISKKFEIKMKYHCAWHPQSAGRIERKNGTIKNRLKKCMEETGRPWIKCLDLVKLEINTSSSTGLTPFEKLFGRPYRAPQFSEPWRFLVLCGRIALWT